MRIEEVAKRLNKSNRSIYKYIEKNKLKANDVIKKELKETIKSQQEEIDKLKNRGIIKRIFNKG